MKRFMSVLCFLLAVAGSAFAEELTTLDGEHYTEATLTRVEPDGIVIKYPDGVVKLKFKNLSQEICKKYGYSAEAEKNYLEQRHASEVKIAEISKSPALVPSDYQIIANAQKIHRLDEEIKIATYNCDFVKKQISCLEQDISDKKQQANSRIYTPLPTSISGNYISTITYSGEGLPSSSGEIVLLHEELSKKKSELLLKESKLSHLLAERYPTPTPTPTPTSTSTSTSTPTPGFWDIYKYYIFGFVFGITCLVLVFKKFRSK